MDNMLNNYRLGKLLGTTWTQKKTNKDSSKLGRLQGQKAHEGCSRSTETGWPVQTDIPPPPFFWTDLLWGREGEGWVQSLKK